MTPIPGIVIRSAVEADLPFILNSWVESYRDPANGADEIKRIRTGALKHGHRRLAARLLGDEETTTSVACKEGDENVIIGWACWRTVVGQNEIGPPGDMAILNFLHYVYVKADFRKNGIARLMLQPLFSDVPALNFTHYTRAIDEWRAKWEPKGVEFVFNPYAMEG